MYPNDEYVELLKSRLTERRFIHSLNVAKSAEELALKYGADPEKAYTVGLVHDICKDMPYGEQLSYMLENGLQLTDVEISAGKLYHAMSGRLYAEKELGWHDDDMLNAIRYHTTGRTGMSLLEKVVFIADFISDERDYNGVESMRERAKESLEAAIIEGLAFTICDLVENGRAVHPDTIAAFNEAVLLKKENEK